MQEFTIALRDEFILNALKREAERRQLALEELMEEVLDLWYFQEVLGRNYTLERIAEVNRTRPRQ
jgi:hypothetical protein